jgi:hypothetical protein
VPAAAVALSETGPALVGVACRAVYEGSSGWFGRDDSRTAIDTWLKRLADAFRSGSYLSLPDGLRDLGRRAHVGGASLAEHLAHQLLDESET